MTRIRTLLLSGENNHDWTRSTPFCKALLEGSGKFSVDVTHRPAEALADREALASYGLLFTDYNGPSWGAAAEEAFESAVRGGAGLVVLHAADNAFPDWPAYQRMLGLSFRDDVSGHGEFHEFEVVKADPDHPVTRSLETFVTCDELYHGMLAVPDAPHTVLATAYSDPSQGGTGRREPVMLARTYGEGRVFHLLLGHVWPHDFNAGYKGYQMIAFENEHFQRCLLRGAEWAATGDVTEA
jgi:type 1 glutamine amidotransferase